jgi:hypothetical protein
MSKGSLKALHTRSIKSPISLAGFSQHLKNQIENTLLFKHHHYCRKNTPAFPTLKLQLLPTSSTAYSHFNCSLATMALPSLLVYSPSLFPDSADPSPPINWACPDLPCSTSFGCCSGYNRRANYARHIKLTSGAQHQTSLEADGSCVASTASTASAALGHIDQGTWHCSGCGTNRGCTDCNESWCNYHRTCCDYHRTYCDGFSHSLEVVWL